ncbi:permease C29B12,14c [Ceratobasidium sp. AG-Ba]|nr:permease C29B12,14c [Ceratobasidium sp. AG-Ba]
MSRSYFTDSVKLQVVDYPPPNGARGATAKELLQDYLDQAVSKQKYQYRLWALSTVIAALLARAKGSNQTELAENHAKDLDKFIWRCRFFIKESGAEVNDEIKAGVAKLVEQYEAIEDKAIE